MQHVATKEIKVSQARFVKKKKVVKVTEEFGLSKTLRTNITHSQFESAARN